MIKLASAFRPCGCDLAGRHTAAWLKSWQPIVNPPATLAPEALFANMFAEILALPGPNA